MKKNYRFYGTCANFINNDLLNILFLKRKIIHYKIIRIYKISIDIQNSFLIDLYEGKR